MNANPYQSPTISDRHPSRFGPLTVRSVGLTTVLFIAVLSTRGYFYKLFDDFGVQLPAITTMLCSAVFAWLVGVLFGVTVLVQMIITSRNTKTAWNVIAIVFALLLGGLYAIAMFLPLVVTIEALSS
jgi:signal transduction histidine kinase